MRRRNTTNKPYNIRKSGLKEKFIDRQILAIHKAIVEKLIISPELVIKSIERVEHLYQEGRMRHGTYLTWFCLLENIDEHAEFRKGVLEDSPRMNKLRRQTPLVGILTEDERTEALHKFACGETTLETML